MKKQNLFEYVYGNPYRYNLPEQVHFGLRGRVYLCQVHLFVHPHNRVEYTVIALDGNYFVDPITGQSLNTLKSFEIQVAFLITLRKFFNQEYMDFIHS